MGKKTFAKKVLPMTLAAAMVFTSVPVMAAPNDLSGHWAEKVMTEWQEKGLIKGYQDGSVKPDNAVSRAEFVIMMNNALGLKGAGKVSFSDVKEGDWYYSAVATAVEAGYCKGYDDGTFKPGATITRAEAAIMIANAAGLAANGAGAAAFTDAAAIPAWALGSVGAVVEAGYMSGYPDGTFGATATITRAEAVSSLNRVLGNKTDAPDVTEKEEENPVVEEKPEEEKKESGSSGGGGGGGRPSIPTVTKSVATAAELDEAIDADVANKRLVINVAADADLKDTDVDAIFNGKELVINFNDVDMTGDLEIIAPNATKIDLNDKKTGVDGTEVETLTIDAPKAEVVSNIVADTVDIIAVKDGTFHAKDKVKDKIEIKKGAVEVAAAVADTTKVTVPKEATDDVKIKGAVKEVNIETTQKVVLEAKIATANVAAENASVTVSADAAVETVNVEAEAAGATVTGEGSIETVNVSAAATVDTAAVTTLEVKEPVAVTVGAAVETVKVTAAATDEATAEISGSGAITKIEATNDVTVSADNVAEVAVDSGVIVELKADVEAVTVPSTVTTAPTIKVEEGVKVDVVTTEANVNVTGSGTIGNVNVAGSEKVTITAPADSAVTVGSVVNTGSGKVEINNESSNNADIPVTLSKVVTDTVGTVNVDLSASDEWRTEGYLYKLFDIGFEGAKWAVKEFDWSEVTFWIDGEQFIWDPETSKPGEYAVETDFMDYSYDADAKTGYATGLVCAYVDNVAAGESYEAEIKFPSSYLEAADGYAINTGRTFTVSFGVDITDFGKKLTPAKDTLDKITINVGEADDWRTEGYVYVEKEITFEGAEWIMEPNWEEHVTYWIDGEQFQWIPGESVVGDYAVEVEMVPEYDEAGNLSMKAMVFAYVDNVKNGDSFDMKIKVPTYSLATKDNYRLTRNETAVIDFTVNIEGCEGYVSPVVDTVDDVEIDLKASDEWRTEGYLYELFDIGFNAAEWAVEEFDWNEVTFWVNGEQFIWDPETSVPGEYAVETDFMDYYYDADTETGYATGLACAYVDNVEVGEVYEVEIRFPSDYLRITDENYVIKSGETFTVDFYVSITESETELTPAKDELEEITIDLETADEWQTEGYVYVEKEITFDGAEWIMEPNWEEHVTYWIDDVQFQWIHGESVVGEYAVEVDMAPDYDDEGNLSMKAMVFAYVENVKNGDSFDMEIKVPTYSLATTKDDYRLTRNETAVIDFTVNITGVAPEDEKEEPAVDANFKLEESNGGFYATWDKMDYSGYQVRIYDGDTRMVSLPETSETTSLNLLHFIPCADKDKSYDIILRGVQDEGGWPELARLEDAMDVTVTTASGPEYTIEFKGTTVEATWKDVPEGIGYIYKLSGGSSEMVYFGGGSIASNVTVTGNDIFGGEVFDLRVIKEASLDNQVLKAIITPPDKKTYVK